MAERSPDRETDFLRDRAATLRAMAADMLPSVARQLLDIAAQLDVSRETHVLARADEVIE